MPDISSVTQWLTPALVIALFVWLKRDIAGVEARLSKRIDSVETGIGVLRAEVRADIGSLRADVAAVRDRVARLEGRLDGWQDQRHPTAPAAV